MAVRMKYLGVKAALVNGRVRDLSELKASELPVCFYLLFILLCWLIC